LAWLSTTILLPFEGGAHHIVIRHHANNIDRQRPDLPFVDEIGQAMAEF